LEILKRKGLTKDAQVACKVDNLTVSAALWRVLDPLDLQYRVQKHWILITAK
jgi:hypothetical protein